MDMNNASIEKGLNGVHKVEIPAAWLTAEIPPSRKNKPAFIQEVVDVMNRQEGNSLPVSTMMKFGLEDGTWPAGTSKFEKRGAAVDVRNGTPPSVFSATSALWSAPTPPFVPSC